MTHAELLHKRVKEQVEARLMTAETNLNVATNIWAPLIDALTDVVMDLLGGCLNKFEKKKVKQTAKKLGPIQRWAVRRTVAQHPGIPDEHYRDSHEIVREVIEGAKPEEVVGLIDEFENESPNWDFFG